jgi:radical SAM superfamily enzyme YgiQ (UPF0313 family)
MPPAGLISIAAWLEQHGTSTTILDGYAHPAPLEDWVDRIRSRAPDFLGISATTSSFLEGVELASAVKRASPRTRVVYGGVHVSALYRRCLEEHPEIDLIVVGEGEEAFQAIVERNGRDLDDVPGIAYRRGSDIEFTGLREPTLPLDSLPFPAYEKLEGFPHAYPLPIFNFPSSPSTSVVSSRGCPYSCTYCDRSVFRRSFRYNSPRYMLEHLKVLRWRYGIRHVTFYDDIFTANRKRVEAFCDLMVSENPGVTFTCAVRANQIGEDLVRRLADAGCWQVSFGVESGDEEVLKNHRRASNLDDVRAKVALIKKHGMRAKGLFIVGLPGETEASIMRTIDYACDVPFDEVNASKFTPFPGAPLYETVRTQGTFHEDWPRMNLLNFVFVPSALTEQRLEELYRLFIKRFYQRPRTAWNYTKLMLTTPAHVVTVIRHARQFLPYLNWVRTARS